MIPFLRLILCLHLVSVPPLPHISPSIRLPPCVLTRRVVCLFTRDVNSGMNVRVTVGVTFTASFSLKTPAYPSLPCTSSGRPSSAPWLCTGNKRSRHALSGLRPWKAMAEAARQAGRRGGWGQRGRGGFSSDTYTPVGLGWAPKGPARGFWGTLKGHGEGEELGDRGMNTRSLTVPLYVGRLFADGSRQLFFWCWFDFYSNSL